ncbi:MAG: hypothetical protein DMF10_06420 [Verrucomicrobia bacterium]|nr:MAG: hypothetical protein DMF10_06420 [Verrucomicrobiota bacterium]
MLWLVRFFVRVYQCTLSPLLRLLCGPESGCRFTPSCSRYFLEAVHPRLSLPAVAGIEYPASASAPNSRFAEIYGSNCVDCRCPLCDWARRVGILSGKTNGSQTCFRHQCAGPAFPLGYSRNCCAFAIANSGRRSFSRQRTNSELYRKDRNLAQFRR